MMHALLFPSDFLSPREVDSAFQTEYEAALAVGEYDIYLYDYDQFVRDSTLRLNHSPQEKTLAVLRGWMLNTHQYERFYKLLQEHSIALITLPEQYAVMHLFPNVYPLIAPDTPRILVYPDSVDGKECATVPLDEIKAVFRRFMVKDYVKSEKETDFPKFFDSSTLAQADLDRWLTKFRDLRGKLFTDGICIKEYVELKRYGERTNEWRVFYLNGNVISISANSKQADYAPQVPKALVEKYKTLPSPFYTVDYAELADGSWKILEAGDGQVSGLSENQNSRAFFRALQAGCRNG